MSTDFLNALLNKIRAISRNYPNGFTIHLPDCSLVKKGWVVGLKDTQNSFGDEGLRHVIEIALKSSYLVGGWKNGILYFYDAVIIIENEEDARKLGKEHNQIAIFSLDEQRLVFI